MSAICMSLAHTHTHYVLLRGQSLTISLASHGRTSRACVGGRKKRRWGDNNATFEIQISNFNNTCSTTWGWQRTSEYLGFCLSLASWSSYPDARRAKGLSYLL